MLRQEAFDMRYMQRFYTKRAFVKKLGVDMLVCVDRI